MRTGDAFETFAVFEEWYDAAGDHAGPHDPAEVAHFAERLNGLHGLDHEMVAERLADLAFPKGFVFVRFFDATTGEYLGGVLNESFEPVTADDILTELVPDAEFDIHIDGYATSWAGTTAMQVTKPGVLDLAIDYRALN